MLTPPSPRIVPTLPTTPGHVPVAKEHDRPFGPELERKPVHRHDPGIRLREERPLGRRSGPGAGERHADRARVGARPLMAGLATRRRRGPARRGTR